MESQDRPTETKVIVNSEEPHEELSNAHGWIYYQEGGCELQESLQLGFSTSQCSGVMLGRRAQHMGMEAALAFQELPALVSAHPSFLPSFLSSCPL